jgi:SAM-dependent methyltransferase
MTKTAISYRDSHTKQGKGIVYDEHYATLPERKYIWNQEQFVLNSFIETYFKDRKIRLLDFACGTGRITSFFENRVETSIAVDVSKTMLDEARKKLKRTELIHVDLTRNNVLSGRKFNLITAFRFFLNAEPQLRIEAMRTLVSLLADDGYILFNNHKNRSSPLVWPRYFLCNKLRKRNVNFMSIYEVRDLAEKAGLKIVRIYPVSLLSMPSIKCLERLNHRIDNTAMKFRFSGIFSESPIVVCRRC